MTSAELGERRDTAPTGRLRGYRRTPPLPSRPELSAPDAASGGWTTELGRGQPRFGLAGLVVIVPVFLLLAFGAGGSERSLEVLGPLTTFALPAVAVIAFWWEDWPGSSLRAGWSGMTDTLLIVAAGVALTVAGQAIVARPDMRALFDPEPGAGHIATFPHTMPVAAGVFTVILQLTLVSEGWPLRGLGRVRSGAAALLLSWVIGAAGYLLVVGAHDEPAAMPGGLRDLRGPVAPGSYGAWLTAVGVWQMVFFLALRGWPFSAIRRRGPRLLAANAVVIACGWATYLAMAHVLGWPPNRVLAVCGSVIAAVLVVGMLVEAWPWTRLLPPLPGRLCVLGSALVVAGLLYGVLSACARRHAWVHAEPDDWVGYAALNALGLGVILHVAIWRRWPLGAGVRNERSK